MKTTKITFQQLITVSVGALLYGIGLGAFLVPSKIAAGGVAGLATILHYAAGLPTGWVIILCNIPLFLLGTKNHGVEFLLMSLLATILGSLIVDYIPMPYLTQDPLLAGVFGGVVLGLGLGLIERGGGSTGGTFIAAKLLTRFFPQLSVAYIMCVMDAIVIVASGFVFSAESAMYALISLFVSTKVMDLMTSGLKSARALYIVSREDERIADHIMDRMGRGVTRLQARGMYTGEDKATLLCVVESGREVIRAKELIREVDPSAFVFVSNVSEVMGENFYRR